MRDFTVQKYIQFIEAAINSGFSFQTYKDFLVNPKQKVIILRNDVDARPQNSYLFAKLLHEKSIKAVFYFRVVKQSWNQEIIREISELGHEIGYHYENLPHTKGNIQAAFSDFKKNLEKFRTIVDVKTICMHGSPLSKYDPKDLWKNYSYRDLGIIGEPYFDTDFSKVAYFTDTGRTWATDKSSVRDRVDQELTFSYKHTNELIDAFNNKQLPNQLMFNFHPQRWTDNSLQWVYEYVSQNFKNSIKSMLIRKHNKINS